jgi:nicotinamidase-related amidase
LIIDLFSRFDFPDGERLAPLAVDAAQAVAGLRRLFDEQRWPIIYANDNFGNWKCGFRELVDECRNTLGAPQRIAQLLAPGPDHYTILKPKHSAFLSTPLQILLEKVDACPLVLTGMAMDSCVLATAIDANSREYECMVVPEAAPFFRSGGKQPWTCSISLGWPRPFPRTSFRGRCFPEGSGSSVWLRLDGDKNGFRYA